MDEILNLINSVDLSAADMTQKLSEIGRGSMLDGIQNIYFEGIYVGEKSAFPVGFPDDEKEPSKMAKVAIAAGGVLAGAGATALVIWLVKKHRKKKVKNSPNVPVPADAGIDTEYADASSNAECCEPTAYSPVLEERT